MYKTKYAFTLAEILITLTIIGILAVVLIPKTYMNANVAGSYNKFRTTFAQIQKGMLLANDNYKESFFDIKTMAGVDTFAQKYFNAKKVTRSVAATAALTNANFSDISSIAQTYLLPNGAQLIIPLKTKNIIEGSDGCDEYADSLSNAQNLAKRCIAFIDINGDKAPNSLLGQVLSTGSNNEPVDNTGACLSKTDEGYAINTSILEKDCTVPKDVMFDIYPVIIENNNIKPYSNAVAYVLENKKD